LRYDSEEEEDVEMAQYKFPPVVSQLVQKQLATGQFATEDEVLLAALQTLETESEDRIAVREALDSLEAGDRGMSLQDAFDEVRKHHSIAGQT
jgi:Arc/MetJ-type ribon-helix-helix transcriptional regulator